jgi:hypothetical protein
MVNYMNFQDWMFDKRVLERNIRRGLITRTDYRNYLKTLEDMSDNIAPPDEDDLFDGLDNFDEPEEIEQDGPADESSVEEPS